MPRVTTDILPIYSLVAQVMQGVGQPRFIIRPEADIHHYQLRPSEASYIQQADIIFWVGPELTPWLVPALSNLAKDSEIISLLHAPGTTRLNYRNMDKPHLAPNKPLDHDHAGHDLSDHKQHAHTDDGAHDHAHHDDTHAPEQETGHLGLIDPHAWMDPQNALNWLNIIAESLSDKDPENAALYRNNAEKAGLNITQYQKTMAHYLNTADLLPIFVLHDGYQYFEHRFSLPIAGYIYDSDHQAPSPKHISLLYQTASQIPKACLIADNQMMNNVVTAIFKNTELFVIAANPAGQTSPDPSNGYTDLLHALATGLKNCRK